MLYVLAGGLLVLISLGIFATWASAGSDQSHKQVMKAAIMFLAAIFFPLFHFSKKLTARSAEETLARDPRAPVLLLRSFRYDTDRTLRQWGVRLAAGLIGGHPQTTSPEQALVGELGVIGPVVAIGKPGERLPKLGAARLYVADDQWQDKVRELSSRAALTVLGIGESDGLFWELERIVGQADPTRVLLYEPPLAKERDGIYARFVERANRVLPRSLPAQLGIARYIGFHADWTPVPLVDLAPLYHRFGVEVKPKRGCVSRIMRAMLGLLVFVALALALIVILVAIFGGEPAPPSKFTYFRRITAPESRAFHFGESLALSDGLMLVGVPADNHWLKHTGAVYVFDYESGAPVHELRPSDPRLNELFGKNLAAVGGRAIIAARDDGRRPRRVFCADLDAGTMLEMRDPMSSNDPDDLYGASVAINTTHALIATPTAGTRGTAHLFEAETGRLVGSISPDRLAPDATIGEDIALSEHALFFANQNPGGASPRIVYGLTIAAGDSGTRFRLRPDSDDEIGFGDLLATAGEYVVVGSMYLLGGAGRVYAFDSRTGERRAMFEIGDAGMTGTFTTAIATNGRLLAVGVQGHAPSGQPTGAVLVYDIKSQREIACLLPPGDESGSGFGCSIAIDEEVIAVGALFEDSVADQRSGAVHIYRFE